MTHTQLDPTAAERFMSRRVRCAGALSALATICYGALVLGMAAWPEVLRRCWGGELYSIGMALVVVNVAVGMVLGVAYVWWMPRQSPLQRDA